ncbi:interleukin-23 receptor isoform 2-T3 [Polymixia lowei]
MNPYQTIWTFIFFLNFSIRRFPLLPVGCQSVNCRGYLTVEPAPPILMGSDMMVYCHITQENYLKSGYILSLELNGQPHSESEERLNCTTARFRLTVHRPKSTLICKMRRPYSRTLLTVCGLDLHSGLPPDKPTDISCQTSRNSDKIDCSWNTGQATYQNTSYNISVSRENGTQIRYDGIQRTEFTMLRTTLDENKKYQLSITAYNHFGKSKSDPFILCVKDVVMPESPSITHIEFWNSSAEAMLHWKTPESSEHLTSYARIRTHNGSWVVAEGLELRKAIITLQGLEPLTEYEFQIRVCNSRQGLTLPKRPPSTPSSPSTAKPLSGKRPLCSKWSPSVKKKSPGKGPSQQLCVWRALGDKETNGLQNVTVFWMPLPPEDYSGEVHQYEIFLDKNDQKPEVACPATVSQCSFQVSADVQSVSVSAVTSYGKSPPSAVHLRHSGFSGPALIKLAPAGNGSVVILSWSWPMAEHESDTGELLGYVVEWTPRPVELHWQRVAKDQTSTFIKGLTAGVRYNVSLYAVTTRGVSDPSFGLVYAREEKPLSGPNMSILVHETTRVLIQWGELALDQQRGFVKTYTIYLQGINASDMKQMTVSASGPRQMWLDCPEGALVIYLSASNSAGEGPRGNTVSSQLAEPAAGLMAGLVFTTNVLMVIIANLICCRCVRKRIKQKCISLGPAWLVVNLPKPGNSKAIRLLQKTRLSP